MSDKRKVVFCVHRFYPEIASTAQIMTDLVSGLRKDFEIEVIAVKPTDATSSDLKNYSELSDVRIHYLKIPKMVKQRRASRMIHIIFYLVFTMLTLLTIRHKSLVFTISQPPIIGGLIGALNKILTGCPYIYNIQDFNPEQTEAVKYIRGKTLLGAARLLDKWSCLRSDALVLVGRDMIDTLRHRKIFERLKTVRVINNWADEETLYPLQVNHSEVKAFLQRYHLMGKFIVMYSGNLGLYYDLINLIQTIVDTEWPEHVHFVFVGDGVAKEPMQTIVDQARFKSITFVPFQDRGQLNAVLNAAQVHLVVNQQGIKGVSVPSKLYGVMAVGKPVIGLLESGSEARLIIEDSGCGIVAKPGEYEVFVELIQKVSTLEYHEYLEQMSQRGRSYLISKLGKDRSISYYRTLISDELLS